jgi:hypothetical protein
VVGVYLRMFVGVGLDPVTDSDHISHHLRELFDVKPALARLRVHVARRVDGSPERERAVADTYDALVDVSSQSTHHDQLTAADVARELGCKQANVRFHVRKGHLAPARRDPYLFDRAEVDRFLELRRRSG